MSVAVLAEGLGRREAEAGWERREMPAGDFEGFARFMTATYAGRLYAGPDLVTVPGDRVRWVSTDATYFPFTAGEIARAWLDTVMRRAGVTRLCVGELWTATQLGPALFFDPPADRGGEWVMVDVRAAYWTLYSRLAFDARFALREGTVCYEPGRVGVPEQDRVWVGAEKPLRNAAWGVMLGGPISYYQDGQARCKPNRTSPYRAPGLTQAVLAQMNALAWQARRAGAVMWLTDAAICRPSDLPGVIAAISSWGLRAAVKADGDGRLYGLGDYQIGEATTAGDHAERGGYDGLTPLSAEAIDQLGGLDECRLT